MATFIKDMFAVVAGEISDAMFISGIAAEDTTTVWSSGTYAVGDIRHVVATHRRYKCAVAGSSTVSPEQDPTRWVDIAPTNKWAMFDRYVSSRTVIPHGTTIVLRPGADAAKRFYFNAIELRGVANCAGVNITVKDAPGGTVLPGFPFVDDMEGSEPADDWDYWYMSFLAKETLLVKDIEPYSNAEVSIQFLAPGGSGNVEVGLISLGEFRPLASTLKGVVARYRDYSYIDIDEQSGESAIETGPNARDLVASGFLTASEANALDVAIRGLLGRPCSVYASTDDLFASLNTFGLFTGEIRWPDKDTAFLSAEVQGLI